MDRAAAIAEVVQLWQARVLRGEELTAQEIQTILSAHPELMPDLAWELDKLRCLNQAGARELEIPQTVSWHRTPRADDGSVAEEPSAPIDIPDYELLHRIGSGGFGEVWLGRNRHDGQFYAIKVIAKTSSAIELEGIRAYKLRSQDQRYLVPIFHVGEAGPWIYYTMPLADDAKGAAALRPADQYEPMTLERLRKHSAPLQLGEILTIADQVLTALESLHAAELVHRDVKPANILRLSGRWCLGDLGLMVQSGLSSATSGTPAFWPPEGPVDRTADLYALGKTLYLLATGQSLVRFCEFVAGDFDVTGRDRQSRGLRRLILRACDNDPASRFTSAAEMRREAGELRGLWSRVRRQLPIRPTIVMTACLLLAFGAVLLLALRDQAKPRAESALPAKAPLRIDSLEVAAFRGKPAMPLGPIGLARYQARLGDYVRVRAKLSEPAYSFLIAFNPDGKEQLCSPEAPMLPPALAADLRYPTDPNEAFPLTDGVGLQVFVLVSSRQPLPDYADWRKSTGAAPWQSLESAGCWRYAPGGFEYLGAERGLPENLTDRPDVLTRLCEFFRSRQDVEGIEALAFPVKLAGAGGDDQRNSKKAK
jgi:hypothetical protein